MTQLRISAGEPAPPGAILDENGANFALFSAHADKVELCLFDKRGERETARVPLMRSGDFWHIHVQGVRAGQRYGYRVHGPYDPAKGHRFNPNKLLIDPYAKALDRRFTLVPTHFGYRPDDQAGDLSFDVRDSAADTPKGIVIADGMRAAAPLRIPWRDTVIYEIHLRGMTMLRDDIPPYLRGTLAGLASPPVLAHLKALGISAIELLPIHPIADEPRLVRLGLRNYWGYNPVNFFALEPSYAAGDPNAEFGGFVAALHEAGIEVLLDVVFNHTGEGDELGPTFSFRGIDNASYYMLPPHDRRSYVNYSGTGNTLNVAHPQVRRMVLDSLRHWARAGVDGFRFDLAVTLGRDQGAFRSDADFFSALAADAELSQLKLIAEPWDAAPDGYMLGKFLSPFAEWNDFFRNAARRFWRGDAGATPALAHALAGSSDLMGARGPLASVNFVTAHDGFTLEDLVSYAHKRNLPNGENNADGTHENYSWNCGVEGPSDNPAVKDLRFRSKRNLMATLLFSLGVPMLSAGDELGRSQGGNNNAYCQDNETSWLDWRLDEDDEIFLRFVERLVALRAEHPTFRRTRFYHGYREGPRGLKDIVWLMPDGSEMSPWHWEDPQTYAFGCAFGGTDAQSSSRYMLVFNAGIATVPFLLPEAEGGPWRRLLDTADATGGAKIAVPSGAVWPLPPHTLVLFGE